MKNPTRITFNNDTIKVIIRLDDGHAVLKDIIPVQATPEESVSQYFDKSTLPLCEVRLSGEGNLVTKSSKSLVGSYIGSRLRYTSSQAHYDPETKSKTLNVEMIDPETNVTVTSHLTLFDGCPVLRSSATIRNDGSADIVVTQLSSLCVGFLTRSKQWWSDYTISSAKNTWFAEAQWKEQTLPDVGIDDFGVLGWPEKHRTSLAAFTVSNHGTFSTQGHLPMGMLKRNDNKETWLWQVENNGSWRWDIGDYEDNLFLAASGPTGIDHEWRQTLGPEASFHSVPVAVCHVYDNWEQAVAAFTSYRRCIRRKYQDHQNLPIIFNDYMNCLMGDPNEEKILALLEPVAKCGAEYFVIDAGWYADETDWWNGVGAWEPSKRRFPMGFANLLDKIREKGLKPGLWVEPEVIGVESEVAKILPDDAFFQRDGHRILEKNRYHLDYRHPAVIERMDGVMDRLVNEYGAQYFKFDYNVEITQGTDVNSSAGTGQLGHNRAYLEWVGSLLDRYPDLVIENCSSGAQRMDYAMLAVHQLQSTSDQQHPDKYAAISAAVPTAVTPEQSASWAYPQPDWDDERNALTVVNSLLGRIHLSGRLDLMSTEQLKLISDGMDVYKHIRGDITNSFPFWPLGLPAWHDNWLALGLAIPAGEGLGVAKCYVAVWRRGGEVSNKLPIRPFWGKGNVVPQLIYPSGFMAKAEWDSSVGSLNVELPSTLCARLFELSIV